MFSNPKAKAAVAAWCAVVAALAAVYEGVLLGVHLARARSQITAQAQIEDQIGWNHGPVYRYQFRFHDRTLSGQSGVRADQTYARGALVPVYVDARDPTRNSLTRFAEIASRDLPLLAFCLLAAVAMAWQARRTRRNAAAETGANL